MKEVIQSARDACREIHTFAEGQAKLICPDDSIKETLICATLLGSVLDSHLRIICLSLKELNKINGFKEDVKEISKRIEEMMADLMQKFEERINDI